MKQAAIVALALLLTGCGAAGPQPSSATTQGRYAGIGTYSPGELWSRMALATPGKPDASAATTADDEHIIVVVDNRSGEVRECGDYSGVCVSLNPWTKAVATEQASPVALKMHLADVQREREAGKPEVAIRPHIGS